MPGHNVCWLLTIGYRRPCWDETNRLILIGLNTVPIFNGQIRILLVTFKMYKYLYTGVYTQAETSTLTFKSTNVLFSSSERNAANRNALP